MKKRNIIPLVVISLLAVVLHGCGTQKNISVHRDEAKLEQALRQINSSTHTLDARYTVQTGSLPIKGQIKIQEDSCLWLSAQFLGMEAGRGLLTDNSLQIIYRMQKVGFTLDSWEFFPLVRRCANAILLHKIILPSGKEPVISDFIAARTDDGGWQLIRHESPADISYFLDGQLQLISSRCTIDGHEITASYSSFEEGFPTHIVLSAPKDNFSAELNLSRIVRNGSLNIDFNIPQGYSEAPVGQLLKMLHLK